MAPLFVFLFVGVMPIVQRANSVTPGPETVERPLVTKLDKTVYLSIDGMC